MQRPIYSVVKTELEKRIFREKNGIEIIASKLTNGEYQNASKIHNDIVSFFEEAKKLTIGNIYAELCCKELENKYNREREKIYRSKNIEPIISSYEAILRHMKDPPLLISDFKQRLLKDIHEPIFKPFSALEIELLGLAISNIKNEKTLNGVISILEALRPDSKNTKKEIIFDLNSISLQTLHTLRDYIKERFQIEGIKYPE